MEERAISTAFSDLVLCIASLYSSRIVQDRGIMTVLGFWFIATASGLGCLRFSVIFPEQHDTVLKLHKYVSFLSSSTGLPLLAASYCIWTNNKQVGNLLLFIAVAGPLLHAFGLVLKSRIQDFSSTLSILTILSASLFVSKSGINFYGVTGSLGFIVGGLLVGTEGQGLLRQPNVDWFHYIIAGGVLALSTGLLEL